MGDLDDVIKQGEGELEKRRLQRLADITEGDVQVDPALLGVGDEVSEEVVSEFKRYGSRGGLGSIHLVETSGKAKGKGGNASKFSPEQQRATAQRAMDIALEQMIAPSKAYEIAGAEVGVGPAAVKQWAHKHGLVLEPTRAVSAKPAWDLYKRQMLFGEMLDVAQLLIERVKVGLHFEATGELTGNWTPPDDWNPTNEFSKIAVPAAIAHDKLSHIEDLMLTRGLRDVDSEELQGELKAGQQRLLDMESNG